MPVTSVRCASCNSIMPTLEQPAVGFRAPTHVAVQLEALGAPVLSNLTQLHLNGQLLEGRAAQLRHSVCMALEVQPQQASQRQCCLVHLNVRT